jgi:hypothetical protein
VTAEDERRLALLAIAGGFLLAFNRPRDWVHLMMIYPAAILLAAVMLERGVRALPARVARGIEVGLVVGLAALLVHAGGLARDLRRAYAVPVDIPRCGVTADPVTAGLLTDVVGYITRQSAPGDAVPVYPIQPMFGFLAERDAPAGFYFIFPIQDPQRDERIIAELERRRVGTVVYSFSQYAHLGSFEETAPRLFAYLARHYEIATVFGHDRFGPLMCALRHRHEAAADGAPGEWGPDSVFARALWPFTPVVAQRVGTPEEPAVGRATLEVPAAPARLDFRFGVNPDRWLGLSAGPFTFTIRDDLGASLFRAALDPAQAIADRRWTEASVDLSRYAGRRVSLALEIAAPTAPPRPMETAGWAEPRLVTELR